MSTIISSDNSILITKPDTCDFDIRVNPDLLDFVIYHQNTNSLTLTGTGAFNSKLQGTVRISTNPDNVLSVDATGLLSIPFIYSTDTTSIDFSGNGLPGTPFTGVVKISPDANNSLSIHSNGLYTFTDLSGYVPYTGATTNVVLGAHSISASNFIKNGGTAAQLLAADGSVAISGTGISISGGVITNTAPNQVVSISSGTGISVSGSYPNFTVINTAPSSGGTVTSINLTAGAGISVSGGPITNSGSINVTNTAPDQVVSITNAGGVNISGSYPNFNLSVSTSYAPPTGGSGYIQNQIGSPQSSSNYWIDGRGVIGAPFGGDTGEQFIVQDEIKISGTGGSMLNIIGDNSDAITAGSYIQMSRTDGVQSMALQMSASGHLDIWGYLSSTWTRTARFYNTDGVVSANRFVGNGAAGNTIDTIQSGGGSILSNLYRVEHKFQTTSTTLDASATAWHDNGSGSPTITLPSSAASLVGGTFFFIKEGAGTLTLSGPIINTAGASVGSVNLTTSSGMKMFNFNGANWYQLN